MFNKVMEVLNDVYQMKITSNLVEELKDEVWGSYLVEIEDPANYGIDLLQKYIKYRKPLFPEEFRNKLQVSVEDVEKARINLLENLDLTIYATGSVPKDWNPQFSEKTIW